MERAAALDAIDEIVDKQLAVTISVMRLDVELGQQIGECNRAWKELALKIGGIAYEPGELLLRHFRAKGE